MTKAGASTPNGSQALPLVPASFSDLLHSERQGRPSFLKLLICHLGRLHDLSITQTTLERLDGEMIVVKREESGSQR